MPHSNNLADQNKISPTLQTTIFAGVIAWYEFRIGSKILCIEEEAKTLQNSHSISEFLIFKGYDVSVKTIQQSANQNFLEEFKNSFDYVVAVGIFEQCKEPVLMLKRWFSLLKENGIFLLGCDNSLGLCFLCGDTKKTTSCFSKIELKNALETAGIENAKFFSVLPKLETAQMIFSENQIPEEDFRIRYLPLYNTPDTVFKREESLYDEYIKNGIFHQVANAYLIEAVKNKISGLTSSPVNDSTINSDYKVLQVTLTTDRGMENSFATVILENKKTDEKIVQKRGIFPQSFEKLLKLEKNHRSLEKYGIKCVSGNLSNDNSVFTMPFVCKPLLNVYLKDLLFKNKYEFIAKLDKFIDTIRFATEKTKKLFFDLVPLNAFYDETESKPTYPAKTLATKSDEVLAYSYSGFPCKNFIFFDQEFIIDEKTANANKVSVDLIIWRSIAIIYSDYEKMNKILPIDFFWERYGIKNSLDELSRISSDFLSCVRSQNELSFFNASFQRKWEIFYHNKNKMETETYYDFLYSSLFSGSKNIFVFGSGSYADKFLAFYKNEFNILGIIDNDVEKHGDKIQNFSISSPEILKKYSEKNKDFKIIICVKNFKPIYFQLKELGIKNICVYDAKKIYEGRQNLKFEQSDKPYNVGFLSGVFDLYHIGHINMFRRAKQMCNYLIVGVCTDEYVINKKKKTPFIPFDERTQVIKACKYVDEVVEVPYMYEGIVEQFQKYHYDVQFVGNDYENDEWWLNQKTWLEEHGSTMVFFPYTQQTSSTKIKSLIDKGLV
ncbi:MAG: adenylyltransferase/cytidyltransferase family protein [Treponemataceae bacterium]